MRNNLVLLTVASTTWGRFSMISGSVVCGEKNNKNKKWLREREQNKETKNWKRLNMLPKCTF